MTGDLHPMAYFDGMYAEDPDPWGFDTSAYERRKYDATVGALDGRRFRRAAEPGCANGALTQRLTSSCEQMEAFDPVPGCIARARQRLADVQGVSLTVAGLPAHWPEGAGDLVVLSEVAYYLAGGAWRTVLTHIDRFLEPGGMLVAVHYTGATDYPRTAAEVHDGLVSLPWMRLLRRDHGSAYELVLLERT